jgi:hypothetical protein
MPDALEQTADMLDYDYSTSRTMDHAFLSAVLDVLGAGSCRDEVNKVGRDVCLSTPDGTFDPSPG